MINDMKKFIVSLIIGLAILLLRPLGMTLQQSAILAITLLVIIWWAAGIIPRTWASWFLLGAYLIFSGAPVKTIFMFPLSANFLMIIFSFLFSQGISNSKLADKLLTPLLIKTCSSGLRLMLMIILLNFIMVFIIPQPFSRIILLSGIFKAFFDKMELKEEQRSVWFLALYLSSVIINMSMIRGDIILNSSLLSMAGVVITEMTWIQYMLLPSALYLLVALTVFCLLNRKAIKDTVLNHATETAPEKPKLTGTEKRNLAFIAAVIILWALESIHGISGIVIVIIATAIMFLLRLLKTPDFKSINVGLIIFLTGAFSIGGTLRASGVADIMFTAFATIFPNTFSLYYIFLILICAMVLHMLLGSNVTTMSIVVPGLMSVCAGMVSNEILIFTILIAICGHFVLPFHHVILLLGEGSGCYSSKLLFRFGMVLTVITIASLFVIFLPWWSFRGFIQV